MQLLRSPIALFFARTQTPHGPTLDKLPNDILVDCVFAYLNVREILRMRRVNKLYYHLTHHTVIWKRLLHDSDLPLPPLPPTSRHSLQNLSGLEAERLLTRAHSLDKIWRSRTTGLYEKWNFNAHHHVAHMILLPGSQYLVASVSDPTRQDWAIMIYVLDSRYNVTAIAKTKTITKAYNLQAKYLTVNGKHGITISYVRRDWRRRGHGTRGINISEYSGEHEIDAPYPLKYECITYHVSLATLEDLCHPRFVPGSKEFIEHARKQQPPFTRISLIRSTSQLGTLSLDDFAGQPYLTLVRYPNDVMFKPLNGGPASVIKLQPYNDFAAYPHRIKAMRPLPQQQQILIIREIKAPPERNPYPITAMEVQDIPVNKTGIHLEVERTSEDSVFMYDDQFTEIHITEHGSPNWIDESVHALLQRDDKPRKPRPVSVFCKTILPSVGLLRITFYPRLTENSSSTAPDPSLRLPLSHQYRYTLSYSSPVRFVECHTNCQYKILPGSHRTLLYTVPWDDITESPRVIAFFRYHDDELFADQPEDLNDENLMTMEGNMMRRPIRRMPFNFEGERFRCLAWDETVGRVCFVREGDTKVMVMDFSRRPKEDFLGRRMPMPVQQDHDVPMCLD